MDLFCSKKRWLMPEYDLDKIRLLCNEIKISRILAGILTSRGVETPSDASWFLKADELYLYDPYLLPDMDKAVERIKKAIDGHEKICVYGDYDADGICATSVLYYALRDFGIVAGTVIPEREDGYGLSEKIIEEVMENYTLI